MNTGAFFEKVEALFPDWHYDHPMVLYGLIKMLKPAVVVEVGTYLGYGACYMAKALQENNAGHLHCIDSWKFENPPWRKGSVKEHFEKAISECGVRDRVTLLEGKSNEVSWPERIDFAYIDGWHSYREAKYDWGRCVAAGASCVCFDDALTIIGPRMVVDEVEVNPDWSTVRLPSASGLAICYRKSVANAKPITFSQELEPGLEVTTPDQLKQHLKLASKTTHLAYSGYA